MLEYYEVGTMPSLRLSAKGRAKLSELISNDNLQTIIEHLNIIVEYSMEMEAVSKLLERVRDSENHQ